MSNAQILSLWAPLALFSFSLSCFLYTYIQRPCRYHIGPFCAVMGPFYPVLRGRGIRAGASIALTPMAQPFPLPFTFTPLPLSSSPLPSLPSLPVLSLPLSPPLTFLPVLPSSQVALLNLARWPGERCKHEYPRHNSRLLLDRRPWTIISRSCLSSDRQSLLEHSSRFCHLCSISRCLPVTPQIILV